MPSAIVVGGGIAGLVMARDLALGGLNVTLLEASDHLGGKVARHTVAGLDLDAGAESFATRRNTVAELARQVGLGADIARPNPQGAWLQSAEGRAHPLPRTGILGIPGTALAADVIEVVGFWGALRGQLDELMFGFAASKERNLGKLVRRRMGRRVLEQLVAPVTLGIHSRHPDELDVDVVAPGLRAAMLSTGSLSHGVRSLREAAPAGTAVSGIVGGMFGLVEALARDLERFGVTVRLDSPVSAVNASTVTLVDGDTLEADTVVLAASLVAAGAPA
ncbi:MAG: FAD-dependent oxidoreductase, partial [Microbacteriaceae bacterium]|nr:FAD-dependent oxidoreductase [Microbacteriaceae bacterium]